MSHWLVFILTWWYNIQRMSIRYNKDEIKILFVKSYLRKKRAKNGTLVSLHP